MEGDKIGPKMGRDRPLDPINWTSPMKPSGKSDFGVYWHFGASEFGNGKVNYIIHKGDTKDQCGKDMYWLVKDGKEVWVNSGDCEVHMSKEAALKARK